MSEPFVGGPDCLCREITPKDRPCIVCESRAMEATTPVAPAFQMRQAGVWNVVVSFKLGDAAIQRVMLVMCADPTGGELAAIALARLKADTPGAQEAMLLRVEYVGDAKGTAAVFVGGPS